MKKSIIKRLVALALVIVSVFSMASVAFAYTETSVSGTRYRQAIQRLQECLPLQLVFLQP